MAVDFETFCFVAAPVDQVWDALTKPEQIEAYHPAGMRVQALPEGGQELKRPDDGTTFIREALVASDPGKRLDLTFEPVWVDPPATLSRVVFELTAEETATKVHLTQTDCASFGIGDNWDRFLSSMKSWLETGKSLQAAPKAA
ncbi:MAG: SRPBCC domain-containing protein [Pseudomonadota bacterium]